MTFKREYWRHLTPVCSRGTVTGASWLDKRMFLTSSHLTSMFQERCATWFHSPQPPSLCLCLRWHHGVGRDRDCVWLLSVTCNYPLQGIHWAGRTSECWPRSESRGPQLPYGKKHEVTYETPSLARSKVPSNPHCYRNPSSMKIHPVSG